MIRAPLGHASYWDKVVNGSDSYIAKSQKLLLAPTADPDYAPSMRLKSDKTICTKFCADIPPEIQ